MDLAIGLQAMGMTPALLHRLNPVFKFISQSCESDLQRPESLGGCHAISKSIGMATSIRQHLRIVSRAHKGGVQALMSPELPGSPRVGTGIDRSRNMG